MLKDNKAFTLIEALVVIGILTLMFVLSIPAYRSYSRRNQLRQAAQSVRSAIVEAQNTALAPKHSGIGWRYGFQNKRDINFTLDEKEFIVYEYNSGPPAVQKKILRSYRLPDPINWDTTSFRGNISFTPPNAKASCTGSLTPPIKLRLDANNTITINFNCVSGQINIVQP